MTTELIIQVILGIVLTAVLGYVLKDIRKGNSIMDAKLKAALYNKNGTTVFITRTECDKMHDSFCRKVDEVKQVVKEGDTKRDLARKEDVAERKELYLFMGKIQAHLETKGV